MKTGQNLKLTVSISELAKHGHVSSKLPDLSTKLELISEDVTVVKGPSHSRLVLKLEEYLLAQDKQDGVSPSIQAWKIILVDSLPLAPGEWTIITISHNILLNILQIATYEPAVSKTKIGYIRNRTLQLLGGRLTQNLNILDSKVWRSVLRNPELF